LAFNSSSASMTDLRKVAVVTALLVRAVLKRGSLDTDNRAEWRWRSITGLPRPQLKRPGNASPRGRRPWSRQQVTRPADGPLGRQCTDSGAGHGFARLHRAAVRNRLDV
jgi:hypothetical protein